MSATQTLDTPADDATSAAQLERHPRGLCAGRRNANAFGTGLPNGATPASFTLDQWEPVYKLVAPAPRRSVAARNTFAGLYRALLAGGFLSDNAHTLLSLLLSESNNQAQSVQRQVWWLAAKLGWGETKVKNARAECEHLGLIVHHNRRHATDTGVRMRANRYGFTWDSDLAEMAGFGTQHLTKYCGAPDVVYLDHVRAEMRRKARDAAREGGKAQADRLKALRIVDGIVQASNDYHDAEAQVRDQFAGDPGLETYAVDCLDEQWPRHQAAREGQQLAGLDVPHDVKQQRLTAKYEHRPDLLDIAMAALPSHE